jgi:hypothetical protein
MPAIYIIQISNFSNFQTLKDQRRLLVLFIFVVYDTFSYWRLGGWVGGWQSFLNFQTFRPSNSQTFKLSLSQRSEAPLIYLFMFILTIETLCWRFDCGCVGGWQSFLYVFISLGFILGFLVQSLIQVTPTHKALTFTETSIWLTLAKYKGNWIFLVRCDCVLPLC